MSGPTKGRTGLPRAFMFSPKGGEPRPMIEIGPGQYIDLSDTIAAELNEPNPRVQFNAMINAVVALTLRVETSNRRPLPEQDAVSQLLSMLTDAQSGNYSDSRWPADNDKPRQKSFAKAQAEHLLIKLAEDRRKISRCQLQEACEKAVNDLANHLRVCRGVDLEAEFASYTMEPSGDPRTDRRKKRAGRQRTNLQQIAYRVMRWIEDGRPDDNAHKFDFDDTFKADPARHYAALLHLAGSRFVSSVGKTHDTDNRPSSTFRVIEFSQRSPIQPENKGE